MYLDIFQELSKEYSIYNIPDDVIKNAIIEVLQKSKSEIDCKKNAKIILDAYIVQNIKFENIYKKHIKKKYSYLKVLIKKDKKLEYNLNIIALKRNMDVNQVIDNILDDALDILLYDHRIYNNTILFSQNLLNEMKSLIPYYMYDIQRKKVKKNNIDKLSNSKNIKYDISFLDDYCYKKQIVKKKLAEVLSVNYKTLNSYLYGKNKSPKEILDKILKLFNVKTYEELKQGVIDDTLVVPQELIDLTRYDISFLGDYCHKKQIVKNKLAEVLSIEYNTLNNYLSGKTKSPKEILDKILKLFNVKTYEELKQGVIDDTLVVPQKLIDLIRYYISFLGDYCYKKQIVKKKFAEVLSVNYKTLNSYLYGKNKVPQEILDKILKLFNIKTYEELKQGVLEDTLEISKQLIDLIRYDISFLDDYCHKKQILKKKFSDVISIKYDTLISCLYGKTKAPKKVLDKILKLFNVKTYEELKQGVIDDTLVVPQELIVRYYISFLGDYCHKKQIVKKKFAEVLSIKYDTLNSYLYGKNKVPQEILDKILKLFNEKTYEELKQGVIDDTLVVPQELLNKVSKNIYLDSEDSIKDISEYIYNENELPEIFKTIDTNVLLSLVDETSISALDYTIILLLFGGRKVNNKRIYYKIDLVYKLLHIEKEYVVDLYKKCLKLYRESFSKENDDYIIKLENI